mmetsp:Transcript_62968/g.104772  ORF Transcript_62968/g.104772 Transcript_62968/m.104772 type:complete len:221 (+) Transcript_62968:2041-2703(+)
MAQSPRILLITLRPIAISPLPHPATLPPTIGPIALVSHLKRGQKIGPRSPLHNVLVSTRQSGLQSVLLQRRKGSETHPRMRVLQKEVIRLLQSVPTRRPDMVSARSIVTRTNLPTTAMIGVRARTCPRVGLVVIGAPLLQMAPPGMGILEDHQTALLLVEILGAAADLHWNFRHRHRQLLPHYQSPLKSQVGRVEVEVVMLKMSPPKRRNRHRHQEAKSK